MKEKIERVFIDKPGPPGAKRSHAGEDWILAKVGEIQKDIAGRDFYELLLVRYEAEDFLSSP